MGTERRETSIAASIRIVGLLLLAMSALSCAGIIPRISLTTGGTQPGPIPADASSARFQAVVFEVKIPDNRIAAFDAQRIGNQTRTAEDFEKTLRTFGDVKTLYRVDQTVSLREADRIVISEKVPVVTARRQTPGGQGINTVQYQDVGVIFQLAAPSKDAAAGSGHPLDVELAVATDGAAEITPGISSKNFRNIQLSCGPLTEFGKPYAAASIDSAAREKGQTPTAYVCRVVLDPVQ